MLVYEVNHKCIFLTRVAAIQTAQCLNTLDATHQLIHKHGMKQRLVEACLELLGYNKDLVFRLLELNLDSVVLNAISIHRLLSVFGLIKIHDT